MKRAEKKALKAKLKAMTFQEKREYYKSKRIGWRKAWYILKWILAGFGAFVVTCLIIMIVQINKPDPVVTKAAPKAVPQTVHKKTTTPTAAKPKVVDKSEIVVLVEKKVGGAWKTIKWVTPIKAKKMTGEQSAVQEPGTYRNTFFTYNDDGKLVGQYTDKPYNQ